MQNGFKQSDHPIAYVWKKETEDTIPRHARAVALGVFDGVHLGHRAVISQIAGVERPETGRMVSTVFSFVQPPPKDNAWQLMSEDQKRAAFKSLGVEEWIQADFDNIRNLLPEEFVRDFLYKKLNTRCISCGFNYRFGKNGAGDVDMLRRLCTSLQIELKVTPPVMVEGEPVSSSRIRRLIEQGKVEKASRLLGRPFTLDFAVVGGRKLGHLLGAPTINQPLPEHFVRPRFGAYASSVIVGGRVTHGVTNVGVRPTVGSDTPLAETWIGDFEGDLYGQRVPVSLVRFLRPEKKFDSVESLREQIFSDARRAKDTVMGQGDGNVRAVLFDFDDTLQDRARAYLGYCDFFVAKYFPELPDSVREKRRLEMLHRSKRGYVNYPDYFRALFADWDWKDAPPVEDIYRELEFRFGEYVALFDDTEEVLIKLRERGYLLGIITNGASLRQNRKLDISGLRPLLDIAVVSGDEGIHKPDPEIFRRTAARLGVSCQSCIYVGDHPVNDIQGAQSAGMRPVYIDVQGSVPHTENALPDGMEKITALSRLLDWL